MVVEVNEITLPYWVPRMLTNGYCMSPVHSVAEYRECIQIQFLSVVSPSSFLIKLYFNFIIVIPNAVQVVGL